jgi:hypothetical protein
LEKEMVANLNDEETARLEAFLSPLKIAVLVTINGSGSPQISPIWTGTRRAG